MKRELNWGKKNQNLKKSKLKKLKNQKKMQDF